MGDEGQTTNEETSTTETQRHGDVGWKFEATCEQAYRIRPGGNLRTFTPANRRIAYALTQEEELL